MFLIASTPPTTIGGAAVGNQYPRSPYVLKCRWQGVPLIAIEVLTAVVLSDDMHTICFRPSGFAGVTFQTQRHRDESRGKDQHAATARQRPVGVVTGILLAAGDFGLTIVSRR